MTEPSDQVVLPALLRAARGAYGDAVRGALEEGGYADLPRNGAFVIGGMANHGEQAHDLLGELAKGRARSVALLDALVETGYVTRDDTVQLTDRGRAAAACVRAAVTSVDVELAAAISPAELAGLRAGLLALWRIREHRAGRPA